MGPSPVPTAESACLLPGHPHPTRAQCTARHRVLWSRVPASSPETPGSQLARWSAFLSCGWFLRNPDGRGWVARSELQLGTGGEWPCSGLPGRPGQVTPTLCACASSEQGRGHLPHWDSVGRGRHRALRSRGRGHPHTVGAACGGRPARRLVCRLLSTPLCSPACPGVLDQRPLLLAAQGSTVTRRTAGPRGSPDQSSPGHQQQPDPKGGPQYLRQPHFTSSPRVPTGLTSQLNARQRGLCFPSSQPHCGSNDRARPTDSHRDREQSRPPRSYRHLLLANPQPTSVPKIWG